MSLKLFEILLKKPHEHVINNLVLRNLQSRAYIDRTALPPPPTTQDNEGSAETDENGQEGTGDANQDGADQVVKNENVEDQVVENEVGENEIVENKLVEGEVAENQVITPIAGDQEHHRDETQVNEVDDKDNLKVDDSNPTEQVIERTGYSDSEQQINTQFLDSIFTNGPDTLAAEIIDTHENPEPTSPLFDLSPIHSPVSLLPVTLGSPTHSDISVTPSASSVDSSEEGIGIHKVVNW